MTCLNMSDSLKTPLFAKVETQDFASHKGLYAAIVSGLLNRCIGVGRTGDARFCVSTGGICCYCQRIIEWVYWRGLDVRRKILQRNRAVAVGYDGCFHGLYSLRTKSRDARFCVSRGGICCYCQRFIEWVCWYGLLGRRKILRLYWADAVGLMWWSGARGVLWLRRDV